MSACVKFEIIGDDDSLNYLQRLGYEIDSYRSIVDYLFSSHKDEPEFLDSDIFKSYMKKYEIVNAEYAKAKEKYGQEILRPIVEDRCDDTDVDFTWTIPDFNDKKVIVTCR